jgi:molybdopterin-biosynthesis enzyme MoeA-like protein
MAIGLIVVGDEILSGKRVDQHFPRVVSILAERGLALSWAHYAGDDREAMTALLRRTFASDDLVFSTGGIGATPDDHTRQAAAAALDRPLVPHPEAVALLHQRIAAQAAEHKVPADLDHPENRQRLRMAEFPAGAVIIPNPVNQIAGFGVDQHWFVPGFPAMAWPMIAWVLDTHYRDLFPAATAVERALHIYEVPESAVAPWMEDVERGYPGVRTFSLPSTSPDQESVIELGVKGLRPAVDDAFAQLLAAATATGARVEPLQPPVAPG